MQINTELFKPLGLSRKTNITIVTLLVILWLVQCFFELLGSQASLSLIKFSLLLIFASAVIAAIFIFARRGRDLQYELDKKELEKEVKQ